MDRLRQSKVCIAQRRLYLGQWLHKYKEQVYRPSQETFTVQDGDVEVVESKQPLVKEYYGWLKVWINPN